MNRKGLTLTEVLIASMLIIVILIAATSFKLYGISIFQKMREKSTVNAQATFIMEHIMKNLEKSVDISIADNERGFYSYGDEIPPANPMYSIRNWGENWLVIRTSDNQTPSDISDDSWCAYVWDATTKEILVYIDHLGSISQVLGRVVGLRFSRYDTSPTEVDPTGYATRNMLSINLCSRKVVDRPESEDNPQVALQSTFISRGMTAQE